MSDYPGTPQHQALLERIVSHYKDDSRVLAVCLFGSLARGNWDQYSDLDLDVIVEDGIPINVPAELENLCAAFQPLGESSLLIVPDGDDAGDIVLKSLAELSIRYHTLATTNPAVIENLQILAGRLDAAAIHAAGHANRTPQRSISSHDISRCLRWAVEVNIRLHRQRLWEAAYLLQLMRDTLLTLFARSRGFLRVYQGFEAAADDALKARFAATLPNYSPESIRQALALMLDVLENDLDVVSNGQLQLTDNQREAVRKIEQFSGNAGS